MLVGGGQKPPDFSNVELRLLRVSAGPGGRRCQGRRTLGLGLTFVLVVPRSLHREPTVDGGNAWEGSFTRFAGEGARGRWRVRQVVPYWRERLGLSSGQNNRDDEPEARLEWVLGSSMLNRAENARTGTWHEVTGTYP